MGNVSTGKILKPGITKKGYHNYGLFKDKKRRTVLAHRLIYQTFYGKTDKQIDHIDGNKGNNALSNLQPLTQRENIQKYHNQHYHLIVINDGKIIFSGNIDLFNL